MAAGLRRRAHVNVTVSGAVVYNCTGTAGSGNWSGSGITVFQTSGFTIKQST